MKTISKREFEIQRLISFLNDNPEAVYDEDFELSNFEFEELSYEEASEIIEIHS